ncbi:hypothetical protein Leryth_012877 [Lithospermum erythrorhizon]|nr:hypothetical protein Leryth_012877 [Lithospermum erythrorhizon]
MAINNNQESYPIISIVIAMTILMSFAFPLNVEAQSPASAPMAEMDPCMTTLLNMTDCLSYVSPGSNDTKPDKACCPELAGLVDSNPICLCKLLGQPDKIGISIDVQRALQLPSVCNVETPPVSTCAAIGIPVAAPTTSPTLSSPADPLASPPHSSQTGDLAPGGAAASPSSTGANNDSSGPSSTITSLQCFVALAIMLFQSFF